MFYKKCNPLFFIRNSFQGGFSQFYLIILGAVFAVGIIVLTASSLGTKILTGPQVSSPLPTIPLVVQNSVTQSTKPLIANGEVSIELDIPEYLPKYLRYPQHLFSGRKYIVRTSEKCTTAQCYFTEEKTGKRNDFQKPSKNPAKVKEIEKNGDAFVFEIPPETKTGNFNFNYVANGQKKTFTAEINGLNENKSLPLKTTLKNLASKFINSPSTLAATNSNFTIDYRTVISPCYWEMTLAGQPNNPNNLYHACANSLFSRSTNGGLVWNSQYIDSITTYLRSNIFYGGDQKILALNDGSFYMSSMFIDATANWQRGGFLYKGKSTSNLTNTIFQDIIASSTNSFFTDYPKLAIMPDASLIYISDNFNWFDDEQRYHKALFRSTDGGKIFIKNSFDSLSDGGAINSMTFGPSGVLYATKITQPDIYKLRSYSPLIFEQFPIPGIPIIGQYFSVRTSTLSNRAWFVYQGPEVVTDTGVTSLHRGRIYVIWSKPSSIISDPLFEYSSYGYNFDLFSTYSDNSGVTWSQPVKINDDTGAGDQVFPSVNVDSSGILHIAWLDHRDKQDQAIFDVYYANSVDGGVTFSPNLKVNSTSVPNEYGGRSVGDYLDMVVGYPDKAYVGYPCASVPGLTNADQACFARINLIASTTVALPDWTNQLTAVWNLEETGTADRVNSSAICGSNCNLWPSATISKSTHTQQGLYSNNFIKNTNDTRLFCGSSGCSELKFPSSFTVGCWARPTTEATALNQNANADFLARGRFDNVTASKGYRIARSSVWTGTKSINSLRCMAGDGVLQSATGVSVSSPVGSFPPYAWTHVSCRYDTSNQDSSLWSWQAITNGVPSRANYVKIVQDNTAEFDLGEYYPVSGAGFTGQLDECFATGEPLSDAALCRVARCGIKGEKCTCSASDPTQYVNTGRALNCSLTAIPCNATVPQ